MTVERPAFYSLSPGGWRDYWTLLHPPYTLWHLSFVAIGACIVPEIRPAYLGLAMLAFFLAVGVAAHALDERTGRPLRTQIPDVVLIVLAAFGLIGAVTIGIYGASLVSWWGVVFIAIGGILVPAYNLEWFGGRFHTDLWFAVMWGGFPALAGAFSQTGRIDVATVLICTGCGLIAAAQRRLSTPVRRLRRHVTSVSGELVGEHAVEPITEATLTEAPEGALRLLWLAMVSLAIGLVITRWP
ncbi:MAG: hypothetical protein M3O29_01110 [Actinomycetota bacterium]|nr:hypothetical protein [Actinomycetota bacterium]